MVRSEKDPEYRQCSISVMDNIADPNIRFDDKGICNYYYDFKNAVQSSDKSSKNSSERLQKVVSELKKSGKGKKYDCVLGVSGGVDSTYLALKANELGLRALCVHFDNGWNSEMAVRNIENIVSILGFDLYTYVVDWEEFKDVQLSYFKANVIDIEGVSDIAIFLVLEKICAKYGLKYILDGRNFATEQILPYAWSNKDLGNLLNIHKAFGTRRLKTFPLIGRWRRNIHAFRKSYTSVTLLNYLDYNKEKAKEEIIRKLNWNDYGGKHYESVFTRFYQGYILPVKFNVDKRKAHLSNLIFAGQLTKKQAIEELNTPIYPPEQLAIDRPFVLKKLEFADNEFERYLATPPVDHAEYGNLKSLGEEFPILRIISPVKNFFTRHGSTNYSD